MSLPIFVLALTLSGQAELAAQTSNLDTSVATEPAQESAQTPKPAPAGSDAPAEAKEPPTPAHTGLQAMAKGLVGDFAHLPAIENAYIALAGGAVATALHPADQNFNGRLRSHYDVVNTAFAPGKYLGNTPEQVALALG